MRNCCKKNIVFKEIKKNHLTITLKIKNKFQNIIIYINTVKLYQLKTCLMFYKKY